MSLTQEIINVLQVDIVDTFTTQKGIVGFTVGYLFIRRFLFPKIVFPLLKALFIWLFVRGRNEVMILLHHQKKAALAQIAQAEQTVKDVDQRLQQEIHI